MSNNQIENNSKIKIDQVSKHRILLIEDDEISANVIEKFLNKDFIVDISFNGEDGMKKIRSSNYSLILLDINLGLGVSGLKVLNEIKSDNNLKNIPVIASTAYTMKGDRENLLSQGFDDYLSKPFSMKEINDRIKKFLKSDEE